MQKRSRFSLWSALMMASVFLWTGCVAPKQAPLEDSDAEQAQVKKRLAEIFHAAETKDLARLDSYHWYGPHFTKFGGAGKRMDAAAAREGEHKGLSALAGLQLRAEDLQVDVFSDAAVATFIAMASFPAGADTVTKRERGTLVFVKHNGSWRIVHEHFSAAE
jgi:ketosteroid isomerase-like protein